MLTPKELDRAFAEINAGVCEADTWKAAHRWILAEDDIRAHIAALEAQNQVAETAAIEGVIDLLNDAQLPFDTKRPGGITVEGNGYGFWFVADTRERIGAPLTAREIAELIHARQALAQIDQQKEVGDE
ncbi:MAG: hypothetical protein M0R37_07840 [Bacteroidales bacterium]|nr:hypothetical protein [Bacteroidales bacterium]